MKVSIEKTKISIEKVIISIEKMKKLIEKMNFFSEKGLQTREFGGPRAELFNTWANQFRRFY